jgi:hypothetical protein
MGLSSRRGSGERPKRNIPLRIVGILLLIGVLPLAWAADRDYRTSRHYRASYEQHSGHLKALDDKLADPNLSMRDKGKLTKEREQWAQGPIAKVSEAYTSSRNRSYMFGAGALVAGVAGAVALSRSRKRKKKKKR